MEIRRDIPPLQIEGMKTEDAVKQIAMFVEEHLQRMQTELFTMRQFLEPAITSNKNTPDQEFNPLE